MGDECGVRRGVREGGGRRTEDGGRRTEDGGRRTEDGGHPALRTRVPSPAPPLDSTLRRLGCQKGWPGLSFGRLFPVSRNSVKAHLLPPVGLFLAPPLAAQRVAARADIVY